MRPATGRRHACQPSASPRARAWWAVRPIAAPAEASRGKTSIALSRAPATPARHWGECPGCIFARTVRPGSLARLGVPRHAVALTRCSPCACPAASLLFEAFLDLAVASNARRLRDVRSLAIAAQPKSKRSRTGASDAIVFRHAVRAISRRNSKQLGDFTLATINRPQRLPGCQA